MAIGKLVNIAAGKPMKKKYPLVIARAKDGKFVSGGLRKS